MRARPLADRFWEKVSPEPNTGCWLWVGAYRDGGYGALGVGATSRSAHRVAWELTHGPVPDGMEVCHTCDLPTCVNPEHLFLGTHLDNMRDRDAKGRGHQVYGARQHRAHFTDEIVLTMRARCAAGGVSQSAIAREFGVSVNCIHHILRGKTWAHVGGCA